MQRDPYLIALALRTLEDALAQANHLPVVRTWGHRLALTVLVRSGIAKDWQVRDFWQAMASTREVINDDYTRYIRRSHMTGLLDNWYREAEVECPCLVQRDTWARKGARAGPPTLEPSGKKI